MTTNRVVEQVQYVIVLIVMDPVNRPGHLQYLERPLIDGLLGKALESPIVLVLGGAGYGKSHAVFSYLHKHNISTVWIRCTERDNVGDRFWENFTRAVSTLSKSSAKKLAKQGFPGTDAQFEQYLAIPLEDIDPEAKYVFVYDDLYLIHDKTVLRFLEHSVTTPFPNITSILISRKELTINLMQFFSKGLLASINESDLLFSKEETEAFFSLQDINISPEVIDSIYQDTEGWAFAIHIAALCFKVVPGGEGYKAQLRLTIYKLIESEVIARMNGDLRTFLIKLSLIGESLPDLIRRLARLHCSANSAEGESAKKAQDLLLQITGIGSFIRFDEHRNVFSIHGLFRDYLSQYQNELSKTEKEEVYLAAARWCIRNNLKMDAILYFEKAGDYDSLVEQLSSLPLDMSGKTLTMLMEIIERIPGDVFAEHTEIYMVLSRFLLRFASLEDVKERFLALIKKYENLPESKSGNRILCGSYLNVGLIVKILAPVTGDFSFPGYFEKGNYYRTRWGEEITGPLTVASVGSYVCRVGSENPAEMERYLAALDSAVPLAAAAMNGNMSGFQELARGELAFFRLDMEKAESLFRETLIKARERKQYEIEGRAFFYLMRLGMFQGNITLINEMRNKILSFLENEAYVNRFVHADIYRGWFYARLGECEKISPWIKNEREETRNNSIILGLELLVKARNRFCEKNYTAALLALRQTARNANFFIMGKVEIKALEAVCLYQMKNKKAAYAVLEEARLLAEPNGFYLPFAEMGKDMRSLVLQALKEPGDIPRPRLEFLEKVRNLSSVYAKKIYTVLEKHSNGTKRVNEVLSHKEYDVLFSLSQGLTQEEIAESSSRSANTIKSIIKRIYEKLGAVNKVDAIRIAANQGILGREGEKVPEIPKGGISSTKAPVPDNLKKTVGVRPLLLKK